MLRAALAETVPGTNSAAEMAPGTVSWIHLEFDIPPGAKRDKTLSPGFYERVSKYLADLGVPQV